MRTFLRLMGLLREQWKWVLLVFACLLLIAGIMAAGPEIQQRMIDTAIDIDPETGIAGGSQRLLIIFAAIGLGLGLVSSVLGFGRSYLGEFLSLRIAYTLRNRMYDHIQRLSYAFHDKAQTGQLMSRATADVEAIRMMVAMGTMGIWFLFVMVAVTIVLFVMEWQLALIALTCVIVVGFRGLAVGRKLQPVWTSIMQAGARAAEVLQENLSGVRVVRASSREKYESAKFAGVSWELRQMGLKVGKIQAVNMPLMLFVFMLASGLVIWYGGAEVIGGRSTIGELSQFYMYLMMMTMPMSMMGWLVDVVSRGIAAGKRIFEILDAESEVKQAPNAVELSEVQGLVRFEDVSFGYDSLNPVLHDVNLVARPGEMVALLGSTGSGKSTLVSLIPRFYDVGSGKITIDGVDIREATLTSLRHNIGIVQQEAFLFSATIRDNVAYGATGASMEDVVAATKAARLHDFIESLPLGYETWVGERGLTLSGGQKQRLTIARTILTNPRILIFDDSTSSVDTETEFLIQQALRELMRERTTFVIAQRLQTVKDADQILVLDQGTIVERGTHSQLLKEGTIYREIYEIQLREQEEAQEKGAEL